MQSFMEGLLRSFSMNFMQRISKHKLTCQVLWCKDESALDYSHTISVERNAHHLSNSYVPEGKREREKKEEEKGGKLQERL